MLEYQIRPVRPEDADDINIIRRQPETARFMLAIPSERIEQTENFINNLRPNNYEFVAVIPQACGNEQIIGIAGMEQGPVPVPRTPQNSASASIRIIRIRVSARRCSGRSPIWRITGWGSRASSWKSTWTTTARFTCIKNSVLRSRAENAWRSFGTGNMWIHT